LIEFKGETYIKNDATEIDDGDILGLNHDATLLKNRFTKLNKEGAAKLKAKVYSSATSKVEKTMSHINAANNQEIKNKQFELDQKMDNFLEGWDENTKEEKK
jgi:hypothetical protein